MPSPNRSQRQSIKESELLRLKYFKLLGPLLERLHESGTARDRAGNRTLFYDQYVCLLLIAFFNPVVKSLRVLLEVADLAKVRKLLGIRHVSLGAFSEAGSVFDAAAVRPMVQELAGKALKLDRNGPDHEALEGLTAVDGTLLSALPRMVWALWLDEDHRAAKMHLQFDILKGVPTDALITPANGSEAEQLKGMLVPGRLYVTDRGYMNYGLFSAILEAKSSFIARVRDSIVLDGVEKQSVSEEASRAGVVSDLLVAHVGTAGYQDKFQQPLRLVIVEVETRNGETTTLRLLTDRLDLPAELVALAYRFRWSVELFFRWFKRILGCQHFFSESQNGVQIQCYVALIASLLFVLYTGLKPNRYTMAMIQFHLQGWATLDELENHIARQRERQLKAAAKRALA